MTYLKIFAIFIFATLLTGCKEEPQTKEKVSTYHQVIESNTIRCGYSQWNPLLYTDPNTGQKAGIFYDLIEEIGKRLSLKIIWQEELGWDTAIQSVNSGRVDMACAGYYLHPNRIKYISSSYPPIYTPLYVWSREGESYKSLDDLNSPQYQFAVVDGGGSSEIIQKKFPQAKILSLPGGASNGELIESLQTKKADFFVDDLSGMAKFQKDNPGKIQVLFPDKPLTLIPVVMLLPTDDPQFKDMLDNAIRDLEYDGTLNDILKKYHLENTFLTNNFPQVTVEK
ncbi:MAG: transporter substrate-binding domain-containing protein [Pseudobdellovibrionaceae bacterium]